MSAAVLVAVDGDAAALADIERELLDRYSRDYRVLCLRSAADARAQLEALAAADEEVALVLAAPRLAGHTCGDLLDDARRLHPHAKRGVLIPWGDWGEPATGTAIFDLIARGQVDHYVIRPAAAPDEHFHHTVSGVLLDWAETYRVSPHTIYIVGESWSGRAFELRELLGGCALPHTFCLADSDEGRELVARTRPEPKLPIVMLPNGTILEDPTNAEIMFASGSPMNPGQMDFDLIVVGAGPAGLSAAVYGASEGFRTLVIDEGGLGGQATSSSLIRNYLGFPRGVTGRRLAQQAYEQAWVFGAHFAFLQRAVDLRRDGDRLTVELSDGGQVRARAVLLVTGVQYRRLAVPDLEALIGAGVFYGGPASEAPAVVDRHVYVLGGANSAGQATLYLARYARRVTVVVRARSLDVGMSHYLAREVGATPNVDVRFATEVVGGGGDGHLERLVLRDRETGHDDVVDADALFVMIGARPHTTWLPREVERDEEGFVLTGQSVRDGDTWPLERRPLHLETSMPGVFAAGDVRHGSVKRVASAVGEGSVAIQLIHQLFATEQRHPAWPNDGGTAQDVDRRYVSSGPRTSHPS